MDSMSAPAQKGTHKECGDSGKHLPHGTYPWGKSPP